MAEGVFHTFANQRLNGRSLFLQISADGNAAQGNGKSGFGFPMLAQVAHEGKAFVHIGKSVLMDNDAHVHFALQKGIFNF